MVMTMMVMKMFNMKFECNSRCLLCNYCPGRPLVGLALVGGSWPDQHFDIFCVTILTICYIFCWKFWKNFTIFWQFWHFFLQFKTISWQFWQLLKPLFFLLIIFTIFWQLWHLLSILTLIKILSIENLKSWQSLWPDNKEWHSIRDSCNVSCF